MALQTLIDAATLSRSLARADWRLFDCRFDLADTARGERDYADGHIPGALYAHLDRDLSGPITALTGRHPLPDPERLEDWLGRHGVSAGTQVVAYDDCGGAMAVRLWWLLRWLGHTAVAVLDGGWQAWVDARYPIDTDPPARPSPAHFAGQARQRMIVDTATVLANLDAHRATNPADGNDSLLIMDARTPTRFRGDDEPIDPVAGRIPGAVNMPLQRNLRDDGRFESAETLRHIYTAVLDGHAPQQVAVMCGSGVTACHNLLAMEVAGLTGGRLYAGSWSEWIRDPLRPVARGN